MKEIKEEMKNMTTKTNNEWEKISHKVKTEIAGLAGIIQSNIQDTGQAHIAGMKLGEILKILEEAESLLSSERQRLRGEIGWILTPHEYESDNPEMEKFALKLKEKYKNKILKLLEE